MLYQRTIANAVEQSLFQGKVIVLYGARQVGKTTLLNTLQKKHSDKETLFFNCDEPDTRELLTNTTSTALQALFGSAELVLIDEAQRVTNIGLTLKLAIDSMPHKQFVVTGSSSFDLANKINEPLTGRKFEFMLFPLSLSEIAPTLNHTERKRLLPQRLLYGTYPDIVNNSHQAELLLTNLVRGTLYKDVLEHQELRHSAVLEKLLKALAFQIGNEVSYNELAEVVGVNRETVVRYVGLLEQSFIVFRFGPFSRNLRNELKKLHKIYFYDVGVRNALIGAFGPTDIRYDIGALWENFMVVERTKNIRNTLQNVNQYFWRTHQQQEIDYVEERNLELSAFEFKWGTKKRWVPPKAFTDGYPGAPCSLITPLTYEPFVGIPS
jgi:predicted AAA+ superfamily ATPase